MTMAATARHAIPSYRTIACLFGGGLAGLLIWEIWARVLTKAVLGYPLEPAGLIATRWINRDTLIADAITWGNFTWFNALGLMAPIGGLSFYLLGEGGELSYMSFVGHVIYGAVAVWLFERLDTGLQNR